MLKQLYIKNFTLIDELNIALYPGFSVITGETGAGKSIILGAIGLLLGNRADTKAIKAGRDRCVIEAHFDLSRYGMQAFFDDNDIDYDGNDTIIRRELTAAGKSRAFINDTPVPLTRMRELGEQLVDIHSQHQNLLLQKEDFQLNVVDIIAQDNKQLNLLDKTDNYEKYFGSYDDIDLYDNVATNDWQDIVYGRTGHTFNQNLNINGGSDKIKYAFSYARMDDKAIMQMSDFVRDNLSLKLNAKPTKRVSLDFQARWSKTKINGGGANEQSSTYNTDKRLRYAIQYTPYPVPGLSTDTDDDDTTNSSFYNPYIAFRLLSLPEGNR